LKSSPDGSICTYEKVSLNPKNFSAAARFTTLLIL